MFFESRTVVVFSFIIVFAQIPASVGIAAETSQIKSVSPINTLDEDNDDRYSNFDLLVKANTLLSNADGEGEPGDPRLKIQIKGKTVIEEIELDRDASLEKSFTLSKTDLPTNTAGDITITVILWDDDLFEDDQIDTYSTTVSYEPSEEPLSITTSRSSMLVGAPASLSVTGGSGVGYEWSIRTKPDGSETSIIESGSSVTIRPDKVGSYEITVTDGEGNSKSSSVSATSRSVLINQYAPIVHFDKQHEYFPTRYESLVGHSTLYREEILSDDSITSTPSMLELTSTSEAYYLKLNGEQDQYPSYDDAFPPTIYASIHNDIEFRSETYTAITYWMFYVFDPKRTGLSSVFEHQSDLETVTILVNESGAQWIGASQHYGGERREWTKSNHDGSHLHVYPAIGAHSMYLRNTESYAGDGMLLQDQYVEKNGGTAEIKDLYSIFYTDETGDDTVWRHNGSQGSEYQLVPLSGSEIWADFQGSFSADPGSGKAPMKRTRWTETGDWFANSILSDEAQISAEISEVTVASNSSLSVTVSMSNTGAKPHDFWLGVEGIPTNTSWNTSTTKNLGNTSIPVGTNIEKTITIDLDRPDNPIGFWNIRVTAWAYQSKIAESEDQLVRINQTRAFTVTSKEPLSAAFNWSPNTPSVDENVTFNASISTGQIVEYAWDFDNDTTVDATGETTSYRFENAGNHTVSLTVKKTDGTATTTTDTVTVDSKGSDNTSTSKSIALSTTNATGTPNSTATVSFNVTNTDQTVIDALAINITKLPAEWRVADQSSNGATWSENTQTWLWLQRKPTQSAIGELTVVIPTGTASGKYSITAEISGSSMTTQATKAEITVSGSTTQSIDRAIAGDDNKIGIVEIQQAIRYWANGETVPNTGGKTIGLVKMQELVQMWANGKPVR